MANWYLEAGVGVLRWKRVGKQMARVSDRGKEERRVRVGVKAHTVYTA